MFMFAFEFVLTGRVDGVRLVAVKYVLQNVFQISETVEYARHQHFSFSLCHLTKENV